MASADTDGDGYSNGHELQDPFGAWEINSSDPGIDAFVTNPGMGTDIPEGKAMLYSVKMEFLEMFPHIDDYFALRIFHNQTGEEIAETSLDTIKEESFTIVFTNILEAGNYNVQFYADFNNNGQYDAPPADHAWQEELNQVKDNRVLQFTHNPNFTDIGWMNLDIQDNPDFPHIFSLNQNYPNPFNPTTTLRYNLPEAAQVRIIIYDMLGREIRTLVNGYVQAGYQSIMWDATDNSGRPVSGGVYIYSIQSDRFNANRKMILLK